MPALAGPLVSVALNARRRVDVILPLEGAVARGRTVSAASARLIPVVRLRLTRRIDLFFAVVLLCTLWLL